MRYRRQSSVLEAGRCILDANRENNICRVVESRGPDELGAGRDAISAAPVGKQPSQQAPTQRPLRTKRRASCLARPTVLPSRGSESQAAPTPRLCKGRVALIGGAGGSACAPLTGAGGDRTGRGVRSFRCVLFASWAVRPRIRRSRSTTLALRVGRRSAPSRIRAQRWRGATSCAHSGSGRFR